MLGMNIWYCSQYKNENSEGQFIDIAGGGIMQPVIAGNIYRPTRVLHCKYKHFIGEFASLL